MVNVYCRVRPMLEFEAAKNQVRRDFRPYMRCGMCLSVIQ
jgi:hypothetical protein